MQPFRTSSADETIALGQRFGTFLTRGDVVLLTGDLGAGKTQFTQGVGRALGVTEHLVSPTFNLLLVHEGDELALHHWDLYRLDRAEQLDDLDYFALTEGDAVSLVEWGDKFAEAGIDADLELRFLRESEFERTIEAVALSERGNELIADVGAGSRAHPGSASDG